MSRSDTSIMATALTVLALLLLMRTPRSMRRLIPLLASGLIALILLYSMAMLKFIPGLEIILAPIPMITGKDLTFSHRAEIWAVVVDHVRLRPILGSGYGAYWVPGLPTPDMESYEVLRALNGLYPGSSHNGYLQILNDLGLVGLLCLIGYVVVFFRQSLRLYAIDATQGALFFGLLLQQATINLSEPDWLNVLNVDFIPLSIATTCLARALLDAKSGLGHDTSGSTARDFGPRWLHVRRHEGGRKLTRPMGSSGGPDSSMR
jgi:O-antigen ligase